jgi:hypothetical protein
VYDSLAGEGYWALGGMMEKKAVEASEETCRR